MLKQKNCKICRSPEWLCDAFTIALIEHQTYDQIIEMFERNGVLLNIYNCSIHKHRHLEQSDLKDAEASLARWKVIEAKFDGQNC